MQERETRLRALVWNTEEGKDFAIAVVKECDTHDITIERNRIKFRCSDTTMVTIISALREAINVTVFISSI